MKSKFKQFHQYQQNKQSPLTLTHWKDHDIWSGNSRCWFGTGTKL